MATRVESTTFNNSSQVNNSNHAITAAEVSKTLQ